MEVILKTTDITEVSYVKMLLSCEGIEVHVLDQNMSSLEGSINVFPMRIAVLSSQSSAARRILNLNGILTL